jgi:hypothetical protein
MNLAETYLSERGINLDSAAQHGLEFDERVSQEIALDRLGRRLPKGVIEVIWIPVRDSHGSIIERIARLLPSVCGSDGKLIKFLCPTGSTGRPFIPGPVWEASKRTNHPIIVTEGPIKGLALCQAGGLPIALGGVWMGTAENGDGRYSLRSELL